MLPNRKESSTQVSTYISVTSQTSFAAAGLTSVYNRKYKSYAHNYSTNNLQFLLDFVLLA